MFVDLCGKNTRFKGEKRHQVTEGGWYGKLGSGYIVYRNGVVNERYFVGSQIK
jgi:hypothetical protein